MGGTEGGFPPPAPNPNRPRNTPLTAAPRRSIVRAENVCSAQDGPQQPRIGPYRAAVRPKPVQTPCRVASVQKPAPSQSREVCYPAPPSFKGACTRGRLPSGSVPSRRLPRRECAMSTPPHSRSVPMWTPHRVVSVPSRRLPKAGKCATPTPPYSKECAKIVGPPRRAAPATSSAFRGEVCGREDLVPRAPRAGPAPKTAIMPTAIDSHGLSSARRRSAYVRRR